MAMAKKTKQRGQAMAEYQVLIPGGILLSIALLIIFGNGLSGIYDFAVGWFLDAFEGNVCIREGYIDDRSSGSRCDRSDNCDLIEPMPGEDFNSGSFTSSEPVHIAVIKAGTTYHIMESGTTNDGCYAVQFTGNTVYWWKIDDSPECQDASHVQSWVRPLCP
jgi:hypothetical protein